MSAETRYPAGVRRRAWLIRFVFALTLVPAVACKGRPARAVGEPETVDHSTAHVLPRAANGRDYRIAVAVPDSYAADPAARYPVLYITDGYWDFKLLKSIIGGLVYDKAIPEVILVGVGYPAEAHEWGRLRRWDLTPVRDSREDDANLGESGHAAEFLDVLEKQIIPFVEQRYRVDPGYRALGGSSLGGLFALYAMFTKPGLFAAFIAPSPAVAYAGGWLLGHEDAFAKSGKPLVARLYMTAAEKEQPWYVHAVKRFDAQLRARDYPGLAYAFRVIEGEGHSGTKPESFNRGVRFAFPSGPPAPAP
jgi:predicted alpha/beta superfamily hydrolase